MTQKRTGKWLSWVWDAACLLSLVGIWPRFIEPNLLQVTRIDLPIENLPEDLEGLRLVQFSDLHLFPGVPNHFLERLQKKIQSLKPDLLLFTGDFLYYSKMVDKKRLARFFYSLSARRGCFAIYGNHDYSSYVGVNEQGDYDTMDGAKKQLFRALFRLLLQKPKARFAFSERLNELKPHAELAALLSKTPFTVLENRTCQVAVKGSYLNVCGVGEYMAQRFDPLAAFEHYDPKYPGIVLAHNPDAAKVLKNYPAQVIFSGHTHGGQVNLPWIKDRIVIQENKEHVRGTFRLDRHWLHVNRGVGATLRFRFFSIPEITLAILRRA